MRGEHHHRPLENQLKKEEEQNCQTNHIRIQATTSMANHFQNHKFKTMLDPNWLETFQCNFLQHQSILHWNEASIKNYSFFFRLKLIIINENEWQKHCFLYRNKFIINFRFEKNGQ